MRSSYLYAWNDQCHDDVFPGILCKVLTEIYTKDNKSAQNANKGVLEQIRDISRLTLEL